MTLCHVTLISQRLAARPLRSSNPTNLLNNQTIYNNATSIPRLRDRRDLLRVTGEPTLISFIQYRSEKQSAKPIQRPAAYGDEHLILAKIYSAFTGQHLAWHQFPRPISCLCCLYSIKSIKTQKHDKTTLEPLASNQSNLEPSSNLTSPPLEKDALPPINH